MPRAIHYATVAFVAVWACGLPLPDDDPAGRGELGTDGTEPGVATLPEGADISYIGAFSWNGASQTASGFELVNDLGYRFRIERFQVAAYSVQLRSCLPAHRGGWSWSPRQALAHHVAVDDVSVFIAQAGEDALLFSWHELGIGRASGAAYCQAFLLVASPTAPDPTLEGNSFVVAGSYLAPGASEWLELDARVPYGDGTLRRLLSATPPSETFESMDGSSPAARVVFTRYPVAAFAGISPEGKSSIVLAWEILGNLLATTTVHYQLQATPSG